MADKVLIVEDEPIVALDLRQEIEGIGCEVSGLAGDSDHALMAVEETRPDLALMDIRIEGQTDGIQTAHLLRLTYQVPVVFLTSYNDDATVARASREMPYGYICKPFRSRDLHASIRVALAKSKIDAELHRRQRTVWRTMDGLPEAVITLSADLDIQYMNRGAEAMTGTALLRARGMHFDEVLCIRDVYGQPLPFRSQPGSETTDELFGMVLHVPGRELLAVDCVIRSLVEDGKHHEGYVLMVRDAAARMRQSVVDGSIGEITCFDTSDLSMLQLDANGRIVRINESFLNESGIPMEFLVGRTLNQLLMHPDPRISIQLMHRLLQIRPFAVQS